MQRLKQKPRLKPRQSPTVMPKRGQAGEKVRRMFRFLPAAKLICRRLWQQSHIILPHFLRK